MFKDIGTKIKTFAEILFLLIFMCAAAIGMIEIIDEGRILIGILIILGGLLVAWLNVYLIYGFGQLIENSQMIRDDLTNLREELWAYYKSIKKDVDEESKEDSK